jgi:hypothetical protein
VEEGETIPFSRSHSRSLLSLQLQNRSAKRPPFDNSDLTHVSMALSLYASK